ncbi:sensor histidine kinase [Cohnella sp.]|uniref:cache domain-containing sensor histidine kinase n=1 Tax=Cohnella sp. TaxID=1883426 RepID=UPI003703C4F0
MSLYKKILVAFLILIIFPILILGWISYTLSQNLIESKFNEQTELTMKSVARNIRNIISEANYFSDYYSIMKPEISRVFKELNTYRDNGKKMPDYESEIRSSLLSYSPIVSAALYAKSGIVATATNSSSTFISYEQLMGSSVFQEVKELNGIPKWIGPKEHQELQLNDNYFYQIRVIRELYSTEEIGISIAQLQLKELENTFQLDTPNRLQNHRLMIMNKNGLVIFDNRNQELLGHQFLTEISEQVELNRPFSSESVIFQDEKNMVSFYPLQLKDLGASDWILVSITPWRYVAGQMQTIMIWIAALLSLILSLALIFNFVFVNRIIHFLLRVVNSMKRVERGELSTRVHVNGKDETTILARGFNSLVGRITDLLEEVKLQQNRKNKAELMLLQAQIKPHFLFNTLESINVLAVQNQGDKISQMVYQLGNMLRISMYDKEEIRIRDELEHLQSYLEIQEFRFEDSFRYEIDVPEHLLEYSIQKLTLQPFVENCIQHGFEGIEYIGLIRIYAEEERDGIAFYIADNGIGLSNEQLARFHYSLETDRSFDSRDAIRGERRGLGLGNVADRIRIGYGKDYGVYICSHPDSGTTIKCVIPKYRGEWGAFNRAAGG